MRCFGAGVTGVCLLCNSAVKVMLSNRQVSNASLFVCIETCVTRHQTPDTDILESELESQRTG